MSIHIVSSAEMAALLRAWGFERIQSGRSVGGHAVFRHIQSGRRIHIRIPSGRSNIPPWTVKRAAEMAGVTVPIFLAGPDTEVRTTVSALPVVGRGPSKVAVVAQRPVNQP